MSLFICISSNNPTFAYPFSPILLQKWKNIQYIYWWHQQQYLIFCQKMCKKSDKFTSQFIAQNIWILVGNLHCFCCLCLSFWCYSANVYTIVIIWQACGSFHRVIYIYRLCHGNELWTKCWIFNIILSLGNLDNGFSINKNYLICCMIFIYQT